MADITVMPADMPEGQTSLTWGLAPTVGTEAIRAQFTPMAEYLSRTLKVSIELIVAESYTDLVEQVVAGEVDIALLPPASFVLARRRQPKLRHAASIITHGRTWYSGFILVRANSPMERIEDLKGHSFAFVDASSTSGYFFPHAAFQDAGMDPAVDLKSVAFAGSHVAAIHKLARGEVDAVATASGMIETARGIAQEDGKMGLPPFRILHKTGRIPYDALCLRAALPTPLVEKLEMAFMAIHNYNSDARPALKAAGMAAGFAPPDPTLYIQVGTVLDRVDAWDAAKTENETHGR